MTKGFSRSLSQGRTSWNCSYRNQLGSERHDGVWVNVRESIAVSCTVVMVLPSSGTLIFLLLESEPLLCQKGTVSDWTAVSLIEVDERPADSAESLSEDSQGLVNPTGLLDSCEGQSWYLVALVCDCKLTMEGDDGMRSLGSLAVLMFLSDLDRRGIW
jgi:hypothetical protein